MLSSPEPITQVRSAVMLERALTGVFLPPPLPEVSWSPSLQRLIKNAGPLPPHTAIFGLCEDGMPLLFDLSDPGPGAILIAGDRHCGKTRLLHSILASACRLNLPEEFSFGLVTPYPEEFESYLDDRHCLGISSTFEDTASTLVSDFCAIVANRRAGRLAGPALILAIDDLADLLQFQSEECCSQLHWLIQHGPQVGVWPVATVRTEMADGIGRQILGEFRTCLAGKIGAVQPEARLNELLVVGYMDAPARADENQFYVMSRNECTRFWIPNVD